MPSKPRSAACLWIADAVSTIADLPFVAQTDAPHAPEHALEVELPFLQALLPSFAAGAAVGRRCGSAGQLPTCCGGCGAGRKR